LRVRLLTKFEMLGIGAFLGAANMLLLMVVMIFATMGRGNLSAL